MVFRICTKLCNHHYFLLPEHFISPQKKLHTQWRSLPIPPVSPLIITHLLSVSMHLPVLGISHKWNHTICILSCVATFTQHNVFKLHSTLWHIWVLHSFLWLTIFHCMDMPDFVYTDEVSTGGQ